ncbi:MAG TPA: non-canonical purine NTP pyrophosphatase [Ktedonobacterales bacterium]|jgi:XTP/dITP diphosphohydrolase|nr:non-canonical purine NTP pyrophosphatase [Ktedonobacterales bacterium]
MPLRPDVRTLDQSSQSRRLLIATTNPHKVAEFRALLATAPYTIVDPGELGLDLEVAEPGDTFAENAAIKALAWAGAAHLLALADDSGLEIDAFDGWPGIASARWIGPEVGYVERCQIILRRMAGLPAAQRTARYRCAIAVARREQVLIAVEGAVEGQIVAAPRGSGGFGYDPIFEPLGADLTFGEMGEMPGAAKQQISHRARAVAAALPALRALSAPARGSR